MIAHEEITIILIDDDEGHAELAKLNLERSGLMNDIIHFANGRKAIDFLSEERNRQGNKYLVLLDINMPGWDGHQVLERIRQNEHTRHVPVIVLTTAADEKEIEQCYALGCNFYMTKPIKYEDFSESMHELGLFIQKTRFPSTMRMAV